MGGFGEGSSGSLLVAASLFLRYTTRLPNLLMNNTNSAEQVCFYMQEGVWRHLMYSSHDNLSVFHFFDSVYVCIYVCAAHPSNSSSIGRGEVRALSSAEQSNRSSVSVCGHNYTESSNFSHIPTVCLDTSQPASRFFLSVSHSLKVYKLDSALFLYCEINSNFPWAAARWFTGIIQMEGECSLERTVVARLNEVAGVGLVAMPLFSCLSPQDICQTFFLFNISKVFEGQDTHYFCTFLVIFD